jgi:aspartyl-tRNA(Asn)/glutamyl-tRNA(Gln) amidotransferase subunit B
MRIEANISVSDTDKLGTKVEVKNLNSFRAVERAIEYEVERQTKALENSEIIVQETRGWNEQKQITFAQRLKEESHDYRYFPEPDLPKLILSKIPEFSKEKLLKEIPELPEEKRARYASDYGIKKSDIEILVNNKTFANLFECVAERFKDKKVIQTSANYITSDLQGILGDSKTTELLFDPDGFSELVEMVADNQISSRGAKDILRIMAEEGGSPKEIAKKYNLLQQSDETALKEIVSSIISNNASVVVDYKSGKESALQYLIGQGMKETKGSANPQMLKKLFIENIS